MNLLSLFRSAPTELLCPRCEKSLTNHDDPACARRMSRRFFFQAGGGAAAAVVIAQIIPPVELTSSILGDRAAQTVNSITRKYVNEM